MHVIYSKQKPYKERVTCLFFEDMLGGFTLLSVNRKPFKDFVCPIFLTIYI